MEIAVLEEEGLINLYVLIYVEWRSFRRVENLNVAGDNLDLTGGQVRILRATWAVSDFASDLNDVFIAQAVSHCVRRFRYLRVEDHLRYTFPIS